MANVKLVVFVPLSHADVVRAALGEAGAGVIGNYSHCSFSSRGVGRYRAGANSQPFIGSTGEFGEAEEERIEVVVEKAKLRDVVTAMRRVHPYDEVAFDIYDLVDIGGT